jgi:hypothetical protein
LEISITINGSERILSEKKNRTTTTTTTATAATTTTTMLASGVQLAANVIGCSVTFDSKFRFCLSNMIEISWTILKYFASK